MGREDEDEEEEGEVGKGGWVLGPDGPEFQAGGEGKDVRSQKHQEAIRGFGGKLLYEAELAVKGQCSVCGCCVFVCVDECACMRACVFVCMCAFVCRCCEHDELLT